MNVGRGDTVVEADLINALQTNIIKSAVIDVFSQEPLSVENIHYVVFTPFPL